MRKSPTNPTTISKFYRKTFIDPHLLSLTHEFTNKEITSWKKGDTLKKKFLKPQKVATPKEILTLS